MAAATKIVRDAILLPLSGQIPGVTFFEERSADDAIGESERPCVVIRMVDFEFTREFGSGAMTWEGAVDFDIFVNTSAFEAITDEHTEIAGQISGLLEAAMDDANSVGGKVQILEPKTMTARQDAGPDVGGVTLTFLCRFQTPANNWNAVIGPAGTFT